MTARYKVIVAHPDDEILFFSSVIKDASKVVICFGPSADKNLTNGRQHLKTQLPLNNILFLDIPESNVFNSANWKRPVKCREGIVVGKDEIAYQQNYDSLKDQLAQILDYGETIYTHNPWGEYGHEDHVQINRVVTQLARGCGAAIWYDSYVSNKSSLLMRSFIKDFGKPYYTMPVDADRARQIADTYHRNGAWTWMDDYVWFSSESFVQGPLVSQAKSYTGALFPVNYLRVPFDPETANAPPPGFYKKLRRRLRRLLGKQRPYSLDVATG